MGTVALLLSSAWLVTDTIRARRHSRAEQALIDRVRAQGMWTAEDIAEMDRLYPRKKQ